MEISFYYGMWELKLSQLLATIFNDNMPLLHEKIEDLI